MQSLVNNESVMAIIQRRQWHPTPYSCLENPMDGGAWWAAVHGVVKSQARLSDFTFTFHFHTLEKEMATHSSVLAWRIPGKGEPGGLPSMGSHKVGHDWSDLATAAAREKKKSDSLYWMAAWSLNPFHSILMQSLSSIWKFPGMRPSLHQKVV